jgi:hypothetical protein
VRQGQCSFHQGGGGCVSGATRCVQKGYEGQELTKESKEKGMIEKSTMQKGFGHRKQKGREKDDYETRKKGS